MFLGIVVAFGVAARTGPPLASSSRTPARSCAILGAALLIVLIGVADDIWDLDWMTKLAGQIIAAGLLAWQGVAIVLAADRRPHRRLALDVADHHRASPSCW